MIDVTASTRADIYAHGLDEYPREACGVITAAGVYVRCRNVAIDPTTRFEIDPLELHSLTLSSGVEAVVHSHPSGIDAPSAADMRSQIAAGVPFGLYTVTGNSAGRLWFWGDGIPPVPYLGRRFRHGPTGTDGRGDCYALVRDWYDRELGLQLAEYPRADGWWQKGGNLYAENFESEGFRTLGRGLTGEPRRGDLLLFRLDGEGVIHHAGIYIGNGILLHHLADSHRVERLSREDPVQRWARYVAIWARA